MSKWLQYKFTIGADISSNRNAKLTEFSLGVFNSILDLRCGFWYYVPFSEKRVDQTGNTWQTQIQPNHAAIFLADEFMGNVKWETYKASKDWGRVRRHIGDILDHSEPYANANSKGNSEGKKHTEVEEYSDKKDRSCKDQVVANKLLEVVLQSVQYCLNITRHTVARDIGELIPWLHFYVFIHLRQQYNKPLETIIVGIKFRKLSSGILLKLYSRINFHQIFWSTSVRKIISGQNRPKLFSDFDWPKNNFWNFAAILLQRSIFFFWNFTKNNNFKRLILLFSCKVCMKFLSQSWFQIIFLAEEENLLGSAPKCAQILWDCAQ